MRYGAVFPTTEMGKDPGAIRAWVAAVEDLGFERIVAYDHVVGAVHADREPKLWGPYTEKDEFHEPLVLFSYIAAITTDIELVTGVLILPQRQAVLVAKQAADLDMLSGGRLVLGVGTGWNYVEYEALNTEFRNRAKRMEEQVELMRQLWTSPVNDFSGKYHRVDRGGIVPLPNRQIPVWFGGSAEASVRRAARMGDGYIFGNTGERIQNALAILREELALQGRDVASFPTDAVLHLQRGEEALSPEVAAWKASGTTWLSLSTMANRMLTGDMTPVNKVDAQIAMLDNAMKWVKAL
jgi:probable F420-dependent oxidoreductase